MSTYTEWTLNTWVTTLAGILRKSRPWHATTQGANPRLHPAIVELLKSGKVPSDWHLLVLEWPHVSHNDPAMLAFTPSDAKGERGVVTTTSPGKYIKRHYPTLPDHELRDVVALTLGGQEFEWLDTTEAIVHAAQHGPASCMQFAGFSADANGTKPHPYCCYRPDLGWRMAVRKNPAGRIDGRGLVYTGPAAEAGPVFVRTYRRCFYKDSEGNGTSDTGYSESDEALAAWLNRQGVGKTDRWPEGAEMALIELANGDIVGPYLDGNTDRVNVNHDGNTLEITNDGDYECNNTNGLVGEPEDQYEYHCDSCDEGFNHDAVWVGRREDRCLCSSCADDYTQVYGQRGNEYYIRNEDAICVGDYYYDPDYLSDNNIIELADGNYAHVDNAFCCPVDDEWYLIDDAQETEDEGCVHSSNAWQCHATNKWYSTNIESVTGEDGEDYHPDDVPPDSDGADTTECEDESDDTNVPDIHVPFPVTVPFNQPPQTSHLYMDAA